MHGHSTDIETNAKAFEIKKQFMIKVFGITFEQLKDMERAWKGRFELSKGFWIGS